jgi:exonuclease SbcC
MKPLKLTMTAFGPFHREAVVDFERLGENPFFIISGPTGAGKTTILDAVAYALYGEASGNARRDSDLRSRSADRNTPTKVSLLFEVAGNRWHVERSPAQEVPKARGNRDETTVKPHSVVLARVGPDGRQVPGSAIDKVGAVLEKVLAILGLTAAQFRQVVLLPQGEFRDFLLADTAARTAILKKLFGSERFEAVEGALKARRSAVEAELRALAAENEGRYSTAGVAGAEELEAAIGNLVAEVARLRVEEERASNRAADADRALADGRKVEERFLRKERAEEGVRKVGEDRPAYDAKRWKAERGVKALGLAPLARQVDDRAAELSRKEEAIRSLQETGAALEREAGKAGEALDLAKGAWAGEEPALAKERLLLEQALPKYRQLASAREELAAAAGERERAEGEAKRMAGRLDAASRRLAELNRLIPALLKEVASKEILGLRLEAAKARAVEAGALALLERDRGEAERNLAAATKAVEEARAVAEQAKKVFDDLQQRAIRGQAVILAGSLEEGAPCPVCGSTTHPKKARGEAGEIPGESDLSHAREAVETAEAALEGARAKQGEADRALAAIEAKVEQALKAIRKGEGTAADVPDDPAVLEAQLDSIRRKSEELSRLEAEKGTLEPSIPGMAAELEATRAAATDAAARAAGHESLLAELAKGIPAGFSDAKGAEARMEQVGERIAALGRDVESGQGAVDRIALELAGNRSALAEVTKGKEEAERQLGDARKRFEGDLLSEGFADEALFRSSLLSKEEIEGLQGEVRAFADRAAAAAGELEAAEAGCAGQERPDLRSLESVQELASRAKDEAVGARNRAEERKNALEETRRQVGDALDRQRALEARLKVVGRLAALASGENPKRLGLHTYYLAALFDEVARSASHRLDRMSRGRYRLRRTDEVGDGRSRAGLDLVVHDAWSGAERPVRTLSGGESFLASLSLALGLSDAVLAQSGGRTLDSLFVDEGFGALDADSLDMALRTLQELQGAGSSSGRAVGVISHIDEVKRAVGKRIEVSRKAGEATSTVTVVG